jgi:hypothetical protein
MTSRERYDRASQEQWTALVEAVLSGEHGDCPKYKRNAIRWAREQGCSQETICVLGQSKVLSNFARSKRESKDFPQKVLRWRVSSALADAVMSASTNPDQEESLVTRLNRVLHITKSEEFFEFILSTYADLSDEEIRHLAGGDYEGKPPRTLPTAASRENQQADTE